VNTGEITDWTGIPGQNAKAIKIGHKNPSVGRRVIHVTNARIRNAVVTGHFQVADVLKPNNTFAGKQRIQVECLWYGKKPPTSWMNLTIDAAGCVDVPNFAGEVISNIGPK
jgi:hypothetical protein